MTTKICPKCQKRVHVVSETRHPHPDTRVLSCGHGFGPGTEMPDVPERRLVIVIDGVDERRR